MLYHACRHNPPLASDFWSQARMGRPLRTPELARYHEGVSCFGSLNQCRELLAILKKMTCIAELAIPPDGSVRYEPSLRPGHYTVWEEPETLHALIHRVYSLSEAEQ